MAPQVDDLADMVGSTLGRFAREATHTVSRNGHGNSLGLGGGNGGNSAARGVVAGIALAAAAPLVGKAAKGAVLKRVGDLKGNVTDAVGQKVDEATDVPEVAKQVGKKMIPGLGDDNGSGGGSKQQKGTPGVGKGRRMPVQQEVDIGVPIKVAYNQWTQFEEWPQFMHRLDQATQEDDCTVSFKTKIWGMSKEFTAEISEQRPDERIQWKVTQGVTHSGVVTFHELGPRLTRVMVTLDVEPGSLIEKAGRGMRHVKRAVRGDLHRFKAFIEMEETETGEWRGTIHEGEVVKERAAASKSGSGAKSQSRQSGRSRTQRRGSGSGSRSKASSSKSGGGSSSSRSRSRSK